MARAIFKSWFVDFDPVHAKAAGNAPAHMEAETATMFPSSFGDKGLPMGWNFENIYTFCEVKYGAPFASKRFNSDAIGRPLIRIRDLRHHSSNLFTDEIHTKETLINCGDIVVGMDAEFKAFIWQGAPSLMNQRVCMFVPKYEVSKTFLKFGIEKPLSFFERGKVGTTVIHLAKKDIDTFELISPSKGLVKEFSKLVEPLTDKIIANSFESRSLAELRDTLLPKLMSGKIRVKDAEREVERVI
ncbi:restriction endonuclease subunit S [Alphaproteobacteria bacterium]|nr:restriction endonuclease subunit S [Alphaproteobacteria bacterium]